MNIKENITPTDADITATGRKHSSCYLNSHRTEYSEEEKERSRERECLEEIIYEKAPRDTFKYPGVNKTPFTIKIRRRDFKPRRG